MTAQNGKPFRKPSRHVRDDVFVNFVVFARADIPAPKGKAKMTCVDETTAARLARQLDNTVQRTSHPDCPACADKRMHRPAEWAKYHPEAGHGRTAEERKQK